MELKRANPLAFHQLLARTCVYMETGGVVGEQETGDTEAGMLREGFSAGQTIHRQIEVRDEAEDVSEAEDATAEDNT
jgi:hypothetical protein